MYVCAMFDIIQRSHGGAMITQSPVTSAIDASNPGPYVGKLVVAY